MKSVDITGSSVSQIIARYARENNCSIDDLRYEVIDKGTSGFLGFGRRPATVRIIIEGIEKRIRTYIEQLMQKLQVNCSAVKCTIDRKTVYVEIEHPDDPGFLIGKNGSMLETLQFMVNRVFEHTREIERIYLDTENYRKRREKTYLTPFIPLIKQVKTSGKALTLDPLPAPERRIIHHYIESDSSLRTLTVGEGENKRIVIFSAKQNEKDVIKKIAPDTSQPKDRLNRKRRPGPPRKPANKTSAAKKKDV
ncbi:MAG: Jag N-terminal domain-containing protein [Candidatus Cloacimonetes bacterium]|nr:Jag N-terminal domain-containing protein [Candidatus Cloacimonadota bacterium]